MARPESSAAAGAGAAGSVRDTDDMDASATDSARFPGGLLRSLSLRGRPADGAPNPAATSSSIATANSWGSPRWVIAGGLAIALLAGYWTWPTAEVAMVPLYADSTTMSQEEAADVLNALFEKRVEAHRQATGQILVPKSDRDKSLRFLAERGLGPMTTEAIRRGGEKGSFLDFPSVERARARHLLERQAEKAIADALPASAATVHFSTGKRFRPALDGKTDSVYVRVVPKSKSPLEEHDVDRIGEILTRINPDVAPEETTILDDRGWSYSLTRDRAEQALRRRIWGALKANGIAAHHVLIRKEGSNPFPTSRTADPLLQRASAYVHSPAPSIAPAPSSSAFAPAERALINKPMRLPESIPAPAPFDASQAEPGPLAMAPQKLQVTVTIPRSGQHSKLERQALELTRKIIPADQLESLEIADAADGPGLAAEPAPAPAPTPTPPAAPESSAVPKASANASASPPASQTMLARYAPVLAIAAAAATLAAWGFAARRGFLSGSASSGLARGRASSALGARPGASPAGPSRILDRWDEEAA